ncbi:hypothetical protein Tsubulata_028890 [Turnera subulata]|uniref:SAWADEE domain-containing protein n=1 Tax=Turnera subulata TaxID=218843 RepID=A0A9Q0F962_9ROSI|nr:hypothetical protein Tsubulata_028890 [Turnera subulata]
MSPSKTQSPALTSLPASADLPPPEPVYDVEFRNPEDDAWYSVRTVLDGDKLFVKYQSFTDEDDYVVSPAKFRTREELLTFHHRFRRVSSQVQDSECSSLAPNALLCVSHSFAPSANQFYDALLDEVKHNNHTFEGGEERCTCEFTVLWTHGPGEGTLMNKRVENLCLVVTNPCLDPKVASFLEICQVKLGIPALDQNLSILDKGFDDAGSPPRPKRTTLFAKRFGLKRSKFARRSSPGELVPPQEAEDPDGSHENSGEEDSDIGGGGGLFVLLIENLEKDLSPSAMEEFIHSQTSIVVQTYLYPSLASETYAKGAVILDCQRNLEKLRQFLDSPNHIIISQKGRPWVVSEELSGSECSPFVGPIRALIFKCQARFAEKKLPLKGIRMREELKLVRSESEEYAAAKELRDLFVEFAEHLQKLHKRLAMEEEKILQPSHVVC